MKGIRNVRAQYAEAKRLLRDEGKDGPHRANTLVGTHDMRVIGGVLRALPIIPRRRDRAMNKKIMRAARKRKDGMRLLIRMELNRKPIQPATSA